MSDTLSPDTIQAFLAAQQANAVDQTIQQQNNQAAVQQAVEQQQQQVPAQQDTQQPPAPVPAPTQQTPRTIQRNSTGQDVTDQAQVSPVSMLTDGSPVPNMQARMPSDTPSFAGIRSSVDPDATSKNGKPVPFYNNPSFYNNLMNFGAATLAASGETDARGVPMNGLAAIGKGIVGAVNANRQERETQSQINEQNSNSAYKAADADAMRWRNYTEAQRARLFSSLANRISGGNTGNTSQGSSDNQGFSLSPNVDKNTALDANAAGNSRLLSALGQTESGNDYTQMNQFGYAGKYQLGQAALQHAGMYQPGDGESIASTHNTWNGQITVPGYGAMTVDQFRNNPGAQEVAMTNHLHTIAQDLENNGAADYIGKTINGVQITPAALVSGAHVAGVGGMMNFLHGNNSFKDGNGVNIPAYIQKVNDHISNDAVTGDNSPAMTAQSNARGAAYGNIVQNIHGADNLDAQINNLTDLSTAYSALNLNPSAINSQIDALIKRRDAGTIAAEQASATLPYDNAKEAYKIQHETNTTRDSTDYYNPNTGGRVSVMAPKEFKRPVDGVVHNFVRTYTLNPDYTVSSDEQDFGRAENEPGYDEQMKGIAAESNKELQESGNIAENMQQTQASANDIRDFLLAPGNENITGPGTSAWLGYKTKLASAFNIAGFPINTNDISDMTSLAQQFQKQVTEKLGHTQHVRTANEFTTIQHSSSGIDNPRDSILFNTSIVNGQANDNIYYNDMLQKAQQRAISNNQTFNYAPFKSTYIKNVDPRALVWSDMIDHNGEYGQRFKKRIFGSPGQQTERQKENFRLYVRSNLFLRSDGTKNITNKDINDFLGGRK